MFRIKSSSTFQWPVTVKQPDDNGRIQRATYTAEFRRLSRDEVEQATRDGRDAELLRVGLVGWEGIHDEDGELVPYNETTKEALLQDMAFTGATALALVNALSGVRAGN